MRALRVLPLLLAAGCGAEFTPRSVLFDLRVLAIDADPLEVGPDDSVTLDAYRYVPPGQEILTETWTFCPFSVGSSVGYACAIPQCEKGLTATGAPADPHAAPRLTASPGALVRECLALLSGSAAPPPEVPEKVEVLFRYEVETAAAPGGTEPAGSRQAVLRLPLYPAGAPADRNVAPVISSVTIGGLAVPPPDGTNPLLRPGADLDVRVVLAPESAQTYDEGGRMLTEQLVVSFYTTAGRFDYDWANGPDAAVKLRHDETGGAAGARVWVVARDLRGGQTVGGPYQVTIEQAAPATIP